MSLEEKITKLDSLASQIEDENVSLEKSLEIFEQTVQIADECMIALNDCKGKLVILQDKVRKIIDEN
ncbi:MAG: exodeoxyribonuclease VII small subunit [Clostridiales bacterium]|nr:exodeoxyribonuclease VII small subunit [Clostridiales bacterium]